MGSPASPACDFFLFCICLLELAHRVPRDSASIEGEKKRRSLKWIQEARREKTPTPKTRFSIWTLLRTPGRFTTRPLPVHFTTKMSVVRSFSVLSKDKIKIGP